MPKSSLMQVYILGAPNLWINTIYHLDVGEMLPQNAREEVDIFFEELRRKRMFGGFSPQIIGNMGETPIFFNMSPKKTIAIKGSKTIIIRTTAQEKVRITVMLTICGDGTKLAPLVIFKAKRGAKLEQKLANLQCCKNGLVAVAWNQNAWSTNDIISLCLNKFDYFYFPAIFK